MWGSDVKCKGTEGEREGRRERGWLVGKEVMREWEKERGRQGREKIFKSIKMSKY